MDGPDGIRGYWSDTHLVARHVTKRRNGEESLMIWAAFLWFKKTPLVFINGTMNSTNYIQVLMNNLVPWVENEYPRGAVFQQDNAPIYTSQQTQCFMLSYALDVMNWPANSPDFNPIENLWANLVHEI